MNLSSLLVMLCTTLVTSATAIFTNDATPISTRAHWIRLANIALYQQTGTPCPFAAFGTVIVNHTDNANTLGELICTGVNRIAGTGNPTLHGEISAITNCTSILTDPKGKFRLTLAEAQSAFKDFSLYTNAESCPMCAAAIRWAGFREYVFGTSIEALAEKGWEQIRINSVDLFEASKNLSSETTLVGGVLADETDVYFSWQFDAASPCPAGCVRSDGGYCAMKNESSWRLLHHVDV